MTPLPLGLVGLVAVLLVAWAVWWRRRSPATGTAPETAPLVAAVEDAPGFFERLCYLTEEPAGPTPAVAGPSTRTTAEAAPAMRADAWLCKPFELEELRQAVETWAIHGRLHGT